jgi:membrane associated rhomboid family serine protease
MDPTKIRLSYLFGIFVAAVIVAAVLRHVLHVDVGFSRKEILAGALAAAFGAMLAAVVLLRRRQG